MRCKRHEQLIAKFCEHGKTFGEQHLPYANPAHHSMNMAKQLVNPAKPFVNMAKPSVNNIYIMRTRPTIR